MVFVWAQMLDFSYVFVNLLAKFHLVHENGPFPMQELPASRCQIDLWKALARGVGLEDRPSCNDSGYLEISPQWRYLQKLFCFGTCTCFWCALKRGLQQCPSKPPFFHQVMCWSSLRRSLKLVSKEVISMGQIKWTYEVTHILSFLGFRGLCPGPYHQVRKLEPLWYWNLDPKVCQHDQHSSLCHQDQKCEVAQISSMSRGEFS